MAGYARNIGEPRTQPKTHCYRLTRGAMQRFLYLNEAGTGYVVAAALPALSISIYAAREVFAFSRDGAELFAYLNSTGTGLAFSTTFPTWAVKTVYYPQLSEPLFRENNYRWLFANSTLKGIVISEEPYPQ
jgi:hypothetical protein